jgi:hypothetical protein
MKLPRRGTVRRKPSCSSSVIGSRIGRPADAERTAQLTLIETNFLSVAIRFRILNRSLERHVRLVDNADVRVEGLQVRLRRGLHVDFDWYAKYGMPF